MKHLDPRKANLLPDFPASSVSRLRACGSPKRPLRALAGVGSIPAANLVGLDPQSKCFFAWLNCGSGMPVMAFGGSGKTL